MFVYSYLDLVDRLYADVAKELFAKFKRRFENEHRDDLRRLEPLGLSEHVAEAEIAKIYRSSKYRLTISLPAFYLLIQYLESKEKEGGSIILRIINGCINLVTVERASDDKFSLATLMRRSQAVDDFPAEDEGIPGHNPGSANTEANPGSAVLTRLKLGPLPLEPDLLGDVMAELEEDDTTHPPPTGKNTLVYEFEQMIKREEGDESPNRADLPMPPSKSRDVLMEVLKVKENRDRFKIENHTGGVPSAISVVMFTFHNSNNT